MRATRVVTLALLAAAAVAVLLAFNRVLLSPWCDGPRALPSALCGLHPTRWVRKGYSPTDLVQLAQNRKGRAGGDASGSGNSAAAALGAGSGAAAGAAADAQPDDGTDEAVPSDAGGNIGALTPVTEKAAIERDTQAQPQGDDEQRTDEQSGNEQPGDGQPADEQAGTDVGGQPDADEKQQQDGDSGGGSGDDEQQPSEDGRQPGADAEGQQDGGEPGGNSNSAEQQPTDGEQQSDGGVEQQHGSEGSDSGGGSGDGSEEQQPSEGEQQPSDVKRQPSDEEQQRESEEGSSEVDPGSEAGAAEATQEARDDTDAATDIFEESSNDKVSPEPDAGREASVDGDGEGSSDGGGGGDSDAAAEGAAGAEGESQEAAGGDAEAERQDARPDTAKKQEDDPVEESAAGNGAAEEQGGESGEGQQAGEQSHDSNGGSGESAGGGDGENQPDDAAEQRPDDGGSGADGEANDDQKEQGEGAAEDSAQPGDPDESTEGNDGSSDSRLPPVRQWVGDQEVIWERPHETPKGIFLLLNGCNHGANGWWDAQPACEDCLGLPEEKAMVAEAIRRGLVAMALSVVTQRNKLRCWANVSPPRLNTDMRSTMASVQEITEREGWTDLPLYAWGGSAGGSFAAWLPYYLRLKGIMVQLKAIKPEDLDVEWKDPDSGEEWQYPKVFYTYNRRDPVASERARAYTGALAAKGVDHVLVGADPAPLTPSFFADRVEEIDEDVSQQLFDALKNNGFLDEHDYIIADPRTSDKRWHAVLQDNVPYARTVRLDKFVSGIFEELNWAFSNHQGVSDTTAAAFDFFDSGARPDEHMLENPEWWELQGAQQDAADGGAA